MWLFYPCNRSDQKRDQIVVFHETHDVQGEMIGFEVYDTLHPKPVHYLTSSALVVYCSSSSLKQNVQKGITALLSKTSSTSGRIIFCNNCLYFFFQTQGDFTPLLLAYCQILDDKS